jgi:hypothetical protein
LLSLTPIDAQVQCLLIDLSGFDLEAIGEIVENNNQPIVQINA